MVTRIGGARRKTRHLFEKPRRQKGKLSIRRFLATYAPGDRVLLLAESAYQKGLYFRRYHGRIGIIEGPKGTCYEVRIQDGHAAKTLIIHPVHLRKA